MINPFELSGVSNDSFREIFQSMTEGIIVVDESGKILVANPIAEQMFGYDNNELTNLSLENLLPERYRTRHFQFRGQFNNHPTPRRMGMGRDLTALRKGGIEFPVEISLSYSQANGNFIAIAFITDISQRKKAEEALRQGEEQLLIYAAELEKKVEARTKDLNVSIRNLEREITERKRAEEESRKALERERELNDLKSKFVSVASHEFRTPLSTILSSISLVDQYAVKGDKEKVSKHTERIKLSVNHLTGILNDFLSLGRLEEGKVDVRIEPILLSVVIGDLKEEMKFLLKEGQQIVPDIAEGATIQTDVRVLHNVLLNLLSNASKYSPAETEIFVTARFQQEECEISIRDQGIGIPVEDQKFMFDTFFRASNAGNTPGTGLGLNIVKRYLSLLGGSIKFTSMPGQGSTFSITIPNLK